MEYQSVKLRRSAYHIGILDFTPFPEYPEFYAVNKMMNVQKNYIYNDKFTLNVLDLNQVHMATDEDKQWKLDYWARLFKTTTWEELKMLAQQNDIFMETCETIFQKNQDRNVRYWCEAREEADRIARTVEREYQQSLADLAEMRNTIQEKDNTIKEKNNTIKEKDNTIKEKDNTIKEKDNALAEKDNTIQEKDNAIAEMRAQIATLMAQLNQK